MLFATNPDEIDDIRPPIAEDPAVWIVVILVVLLLLAMIAYFLWPNAKPKPVQPPLPKEVAKRRLEAVKPKIATANGYDFSIEVSDILRNFTEQQFGISAVRQTSIEFLNEVARTSRFDRIQQERLREFLSICDSVKFARIQTGPGESARLFGQAWAFVEEAK